MNPKMNAVGRHPFALWICCALLLSFQATGAHAAPSEALRIYLEGVETSLADSPDEPVLQSARGVLAFYREVRYAPVWSRGGLLEGQFPGLEAALRESAAHGLNPDRYHLRALIHREVDSAAGNDPPLEVLATDAFLTQAQHRSVGVVVPKDLDPDWHLIPPEVDPVALLLRTVRERRNVKEVLDELWPKYPEYARLVAQRARILQLGETTSVQVAPGPMLRLGDRGYRVLMLKHRLLGPGDYSPEFDEALRVAVVEFQRAARLETDGRVGPATLGALNETKVAWIDRIDANLERWRWLPAERPGTYARVNIADFRLAVISEDREVLGMGVIVGRPFRNTPVFTAVIRYLVLNPYWNVPRTIAVQDKLTLLKKGAAEMAAEGFEVRLPGEEAYVPVDAIDWQGVTQGNYRFRMRQRPGPTNPLGQVKIMLPNDYEVYLHDTPARELFAKQERSFSSGCVRLSDPKLLARWILEHDGRDEELSHFDERLAGGDTTAIYLRKPIPVIVVYFTAFTDANGAIVFRRDLYARDAAIVRALRGTP